MTEILDLIENGLGQRLFIQIGKPFSQTDFIEGGPFEFVGEFFITRAFRGHEDRPAAAGIQSGGGEVPFPKIFELLFFDHVLRVEGAVTPFPQLQGFGIAEQEDELSVFRPGDEIGLTSIIERLEPILGDISAPVGNDTR